MADQLFGGLAGAIVVVRNDEVPLPVERERVLVVTDVTLDGDRVAPVGMPERMMGREGDLVLVNGQIEPTVTVAPGGYERWRIINACTARSLRLRIGGAELLQIAGDAGPLAEPTNVDEVTLATGNRAELLVRIAEAGQHRLVAEPVDRGTGGIGQMMGRQPVSSSEAVTLLHVNAGGTWWRRRSCPTGWPNSTTCAAWRSTENGA